MTSDNSGADISIPKGSPEINQDFELNAWKRCCHRRERWVTSKTDSVSKARLSLVVGLANHCFGGLFTDSEQELGRVWVRVV